MTMYFPRNGSLTSPLACDGSVLMPRTTQHLDYRPSGTRGPKFRIRVCQVAACEFIRLHYSDGPPPSAPLGMIFPVIGTAYFAN